MVPLLKSLGLDVVGVDVSPRMVQQAIRQNPGVPFHLIKSAIVPLPSAHFDLALACLILFEIPTLAEMVDVFNEIHRLLNAGGVFIAITGSEDMYRRNWLTLDNDYPENKALKSGQVARVKLLDIDLELQDYYWTDTDYQSVAAKAKFKLEKILFPTGHPEDATPWKDELYYSPYAIYVMCKDLD